ncbi:MAG: class I tRNA ligase family protein, partial [Phycisphaeraceae bacterium]
MLEIPLAMTTELAKMYRPADVEPQIAEKWLAARAFHAEPVPPQASSLKPQASPYCIVIPPPNVTAALHMGHALNNTLQDILIRYHRMLGDNTMWMPGTDHAGIATQTVVEKRVLAEEGMRRTDFKRDEFVARIQTWKDEYEARITEQLKAMGCSCDWDRQRFTMDPVCARAVREAFFQLFKAGLIYRGKRLVNWDPVTQTALADDEVEMQEIDGHFWYLKYPLEDGSGHVTVATTRPETMLGDTAVAVNPNDKQRAAFIGRNVRLPIVNRIVPIIADDYVVIPNPDSDDAKEKYASGFLKVTPAHDPNDWEIGQRHNLPAINVMAPDASISDQHGWEDVSDECKPLVGLSREDARKWIVDWFKQHDLLEEVRPYRHTIGHSYRSHVPIEPYLSDQWYVKVTDDRLAGAALCAMAEEQRGDSDGCVWKSGDSSKSEIRNPKSKIREAKSEIDD